MILYKKIENLIAGIISILAIFFVFVGGMHAGGIGNLAMIDERFGSNLNSLPSVH